MEGNSCLLPGGPECRQKNRILNNLTSSFDSLQNLQPIFRCWKRQDTRTLKPLLEGSFKAISRAGDRSDHYRSAHADGEGKELI